MFFSRLIYPANLSLQTVSLILCSKCHIAQLLQMLSLWIIFLFFFSDFSYLWTREWQKVSGLWTDTIGITWGFFFFLFLNNALGSISIDSVGQKKDKGSPFLEWESLSFILKGDHGPW